jgi:uncharacterized protein (TIGR03118 family)
MLFSSWLRNGKRTAPAPRFRPRVQALEDRCLLSGYQQINLVGYQPGMGHFTDSNLNGWGMTSMPDGSFVVSNPFSTGLATFYDRSGHVLPQTIIVPASAAQPFGPTGEPTGVVYNSTSDFVISSNGKSAPARLIFDTLDGTISGWNPAVDPTHAIVMVDNGAAGDIYTGLEIAQNGHGQNVLYATDFTKNRVEMFGGAFNAIGSFTDSTVKSIDSSLGAWSVQAVNGNLYVTFASLTDFASGVVDVFDTDGHLLTPNHFAANGPGAGPLQNPWGIVQAPRNFGAYSNDLLIGNVAGAGNINVFDPATGAYLGQLDQPNGTPIAITGLWDLEFGDGTPHGGKTNELFFDAGPNAPGVIGYGLFGVIHAAGDQGNQLGPQQQVSVVSTSIVSSPTMLSSTMPTPPRLSPNSMPEQQIDAIFQEFGAVSLSPDSNPIAMDQQLSGFYAMLKSSLEGLDATGLGRLDALETAGLRMM